MTTQINAAELVQKQTEAWNAHDPGAVTRGYADRVTVLDPLYSEPLTSHEAIAKDATDFFTAFPDMAFRITKVLSDGDTVALEGIAGGTNTGPLALPTGTIPPTNKRVEFSISIFMNLDSDGRIREERRYYDVAGQLAQLGLMP